MHLNPAVTRAASRIMAGHQGVRHFANGDMRILRNVAAMEGLPLYVDAPETAETLAHKVGIARSILASARSAYVQAREGIGFANRARGAHGKLARRSAFLTFNAKLRALKAAEAGLAAAEAALADAAPFRFLLAAD